jgi:hypothetical protein
MGQSIVEFAGDFRMAVPAGDGGGHAAVGRLVGSAGAGA